jgi:DNA polymerase III subunit chi
MGVPFDRVANPCRSRRLKAAVPRRVVALSLRLAGPANLRYTRKMTDFLFYHLLSQPLETALPQLVEKSREKGWRVIVQALTQERLAALDERLWTYEDASFLPHAIDNEGDAATQPVLLTTSPTNANGAQIRFLTDGAPIPDDATRYERIAVLFDGNDPDAVASARENWRDIKSRGLDVTYWRQNAQGRWEKGG